MVYVVHGMHCNIAFLMAYLHTHTYLSFLCVYVCVRIVVVHVLLLLRLLLLHLFSLVCQHVQAHTLAFRTHYLRVQAARVHSDCWTDAISIELSC